MENQELSEESKKVLEAQKKREEEDRASDALFLSAVLNGRGV